MEAIFRANKSIKGFLAWMALAILTGVTPSALFAAPTIEPFGQDDGSNQLQVDFDGTVRVVLSYDGKQGAAQLALKSFTDRNGKPAQVSFLDNEQKSTDLNLDQFSGKEVLTFVVDGATPGITYFGELSVKVGSDEPELVDIALQQGQPDHHLAFPDGVSVETVPVSPNGYARLNVDVRLLLNRIDKAKITLSSFVPEDDPMLFDVYITSPQTPGAEAGTETSDTTQHLSEVDQIPLQDDFLNIEFDASKIPFSKTVRGTLTVGSEDTSLVVFLELTKNDLPKNAEPYLDEPTLVFEKTCLWLWGGCTPSEVQTVHLSEVGGDESLIGVNVSTARAPSEPAAAKLLPKEALFVRFGKDTSLFGIDSSNAASLQERTVKPNDSRVVQVGFEKDLDVGQYKTSLEFRALNADPDRLKTLSVVVRVNRHWGWGFGVLFLGLLFSYIASNGIQARNKRAAIAQRLADMKKRHSFISDTSGTKPIVQALAKISSIWRFMDQQGTVAKWVSPPHFETKVQKLEKHLPLLDRLSNAMAYWKGKETLLARRAKIDLRDQVIEKLYLVDLEKDPEEALKTALDDMDGWQDDAQATSKYLTSLNAAVQKLKRDITKSGLDNKMKEDVNKAFDNFDSILPSYDTFNVAVVKLNSVKTDLKTTPSPSLDVVIAALESIEATYNLLRDFLREVRKSVLDLAADSPMGSTGGIEGFIKEKFENELEKITQQHNELKVYFPNITQEIPQGLHEKVEQVETDLANLIFNKSELDEHLKEIHSLDKKLFSSYPAVIAWLYAQVDRVEDIKALNLDSGTALEKVYAALKVFHVSEGKTELVNSLLESYRNSGKPDDLFKIRDEYIWAQLKDNLRLQTPPNKTEADLNGKSGKAREDELSGTVQDSYELIQFKVAPTNNATELEKSFLFKEGLKWTWNIVGDGVNLTPVTYQPEVAQFIPKALDEVKVTVTVEYERKGNNPYTLPQSYFKTRKPIQFHFWENLTRIEFFYIALALLIAVPGAFLTQYVQADLGGSFIDYITLFLWGVGSDQVRNLVQQHSEAGATL